jgi:hypothetical protein
MKVRDGTHSREFIRPEDPITRAEAMELALSIIEYATDLTFYTGLAIVRDKSADNQDERTETRRAIQASLDQIKDMFLAPAEADDDG